MQIPDNVQHFFTPVGDFQHIKKLGHGNINHTWRITNQQGQHLILQHLRATVFPQPDILMRNLLRVCAQLHEQESQYRFFQLVECRPNPDEKQWYIDENGDCWRLLTYLEKTTCMEHISIPAQARELGLLLGYFHQQMQDLEQYIISPLPDFHHTPKVVHHYEEVQKNVGKQKGEKEQYCHGHIKRYRQLAPLLSEDTALSHGVIHADPKVANFLFCQKKKQAVSLIDFDTVMPGPLLYDIGDALRSCCNDPKSGTFSVDFFTEFLQGYALRADTLLLPADRRKIITAVQVICFELGTRFFTDYLQGDIYFHTTHPGHNLERAMEQFRLHQSIVDQEELLQDIVQETLAS